ncbi:hypothetical protein EVG20_g9228 [Dentipellis fragilis]|uniref:Peptidase S1 domain-containing protein n=1 Tax=Dentipellis fragilis TaxID=205917 RepID=A0A4Y9XZV0_9AGAM|nr:hypothetical protein EVG20_g9228 [Dentipellis fragilis]
MSSRRWVFVIYVTEDLRLVHSWTSTRTRSSEDAKAAAEGCKDILGGEGLHFASSESDRVFLLTASHVARPPAVYQSRKRKGPSREKIVALGHNAYAEALYRMMSTIGHELLSIKTWKEEIERLGPAVEGEDVDEVHSEVTRYWTTLNQRVIGYVVYAPAISVDDCPKHFIRDWALIDLYRDKIDWDTFQGNKIYVGGKISQSNFKYPPGGLLQVTGILKDDEIRKPQQLDANGEKCLIVTKNGNTTGTTLGRLAGMESFVRRYSEYGIKKISIEIAVYPYSNEDGAFSAPGDSGAIVVDSKGSIVGMLVAGAGTTEETDVTYLTPYWWIEEQIKKVFPKSFLYETVK